MSACIHGQWPWYLGRTSGPHWPVTFPSVLTQVLRFYRFEYCRFWIGWHFPRLHLYVPPPPSCMSACTPIHSLWMGGSPPLVALIYFPHSGVLYSSSTVLSYPVVPLATPTPKASCDVVPLPSTLYLSDTIILSLDLRITLVPKKVVIHSPVAVDTTHSTRDIYVRTKHCYLTICIIQWRPYDI